MMDCLPHIHVAAYHAPAEYNNNTPGIGALCFIDGKLSFGVGTYYNSIKKESSYAVVNYQPFKISNVSIGGTVGVVTGYSTSAIPLAALSLTAPFKGLNGHLAIIPPVSGYSPATIGVSFSIPY